jgi:hypothetical protein
VFGQLIVYAASQGHQGVVSLQPVIDLKRSSDIMENEI